MIQQGVDYARYGNWQIKKISEFEFLIENADIDIGRNKELISGEYGLKQPRQKQFRMSFNQNSCK